MRKITILFMLLTTVIGVSAQELRTLKAYLPEAPLEFARITSDGVNLREEPSATSNRLMEACSDEGVWYEWKQNPTKGLTPCHPEKGETMLVLDRSGEWIYLLCRVTGYYMPVWIKESFCEVRQALPVIQQTFSKNGLVYFRNKGQFKDLCIFDVTPEFMDDSEGLYIGTIKDGYLVLPRRFNGLGPWTQGSTVEIKEFPEDGSYALIVPESITKAGEDESGAGALIPDFSKFTDKNIADLIGHTAEGDEIIFAGDPFNGGYRRVSIYDVNHPQLSGLNLKPVTLEIQSEAAKPRRINNPKISYINKGTTLDKVILSPEGTTLEMSFINRSGLKQWNVNRDAYITCDATPGKKYYLMRTSGVNISPKPTYLTGNTSQKVSFSMTFEPIPLESSRLELIEGPSMDNFHAKDVVIEQTKDSSENSIDAGSNDGEFVAPQYPGGDSAIFSFISKKLKYPAEAQVKGIQGRVKVRYTVNADGSVSNVHVVQNVDPYLDAEAIRVVSLLKGFKPATKGGKPVEVRQIVPVPFKLN